MRPGGRTGSGHVHQDSGGVRRGGPGEPPPEGYATWEDFGHAIGLPEERFGDQASLIDPAGEGPRIYFQRVPAGKTAKNRVHLDVRVAGREVRGDSRERLIEERVARLAAAGATEA